MLRGNKGSMALNFENFCDMALRRKRRRRRFIRIQ
jgi:hypothetical protein